VEFRILGPLEVVQEGRPIELPRRLSRALLAYLLLHANEPVSSDRLVDELWGPGAPKTATASLQNYVSRLRKTLGADVVQLEPAGYVLRIDPERFDLARFDRLVEEAQGAPPKQRAELLRAALSLWRGPPLEDLAYEEFAQEEIGHLAERRLGALEDRIGAELELGAGVELIDELEQLIAAHPLRERLRGQLMLALYRAGRQADALAAYQEARRVLDEELGLQPSEELRAVERNILEQDPSLWVAGTERATSESRRTVTVLFCDIVDSTRLAIQLDAEAYRRLMSLYFDAVRGAVEAHGGTVEKFIGDAVMALFGVPERHEDDALRAVRAAVDTRAAVARLNEEARRDWDSELAVRLAVNTGEVISSGSDVAVMGAALNVAAHLEQRAGANEIVLGEETQALVKDAVLAEHVELGDNLSGWRLKEVIADAPAVERRLDAPLIGREKELRRLRTTFQRVRKAKSCGVVTIVGEAGIGKTRLAREFVGAAKEDARVLVGRCVAYGAGATYLPIAEIVRQASPEASAAGIASLLAAEEDTEQVAQRVAEVVGWAEGPAAPGEAFWAIRRLLEATAREQPLIVALDDIHWAEPTLLDLVEYLGEWVDAPVLILCLARPDLLESRPGWGGPTSTGFVVELDPLPAEAVTALVDELAGGPVAPDVQDRIVERAGGNPLFAEQLLALAAEAPEVSLDQAPPTVEALIASRLDRLDPRELDVLRRAAVIGRHFTRADVKDLGSLEDADLAGLERRALVHAIDGRFAFHHALVRDVAYRGIPKAERAELHERAADSLARRDGADELVGYHLEQAYLYRIELARVDDRANRLAHAAGNRLGRAGVRAWKRADAPATTNLLQRAVDLLPAHDPKRRELLCELGLAVRQHGNPDGAEQIFTEAAALSSAEHDARVELRARVELASLRLYRAPEELQEQLDFALKAIATLETHGEDRALGRAWMLVGAIRGQFQCLNVEWSDAATRAAHHYRAAGFSAAWCVGDIANAAYYGPETVENALRLCDTLLAENAEDRAIEANVLTTIACLYAEDGRFDDARSCINRAVALWEDLGQSAAAQSSLMSLGTVELLDDQPDAAEAALRAGCKSLAQRGDTAFLASRASELAEALYVQGRYVEAQSWAETARENAVDGDLHAQAMWRSISAKFEAQAGQFERAEALSSEALGLLAQTDALNDRGKVLLDRAEVFRLAGRDDAARETARTAAALFREKGNLVLAARAEAMFHTSTLV
jgi:DNA-binding SARP family transcriptional activator